MLSHRILGKGNRVLLFCHGYLGSQLIWDEVYPEFEKDFRILLLDLPGHGESDNYDELHSMEFMAEKILEVLVELKIDKVDFIGHSMGGYVGLAFAELFPERLSSLTLVNSTGKSDNQERKRNRLRSVELANRNFETYVRATIRSLFPGGFENGQSRKIERAIHIAMKTTAEGLRAALLGMKVRADRTHLLTNSPIPIYFVGGKNDPVLLWSELETIHCALVDSHQWINDGGHMSMFENPEGLANAIKQFLQLST